MADVGVEQQQLIAELANFAALGIAHMAVDLARQGRLDRSTIRHLRAQLDQAADRLSSEHALTITRLQELLAGAFPDGPETGQGAMEKG